MNSIELSSSICRKRFRLIPQKVFVAVASSRACIELLSLFSRAVCIPQISHPSSEPLLPPHNFHSLRRLPECPSRCQPVHISHPMPITGLQPHRTLVSHTHSPDRAAGFHTLPRQLPYANIQVSAVSLRLSPCTRHPSLQKLISWK